jgi:mannose-6-phosphate isomerase-like protein (cupin superfamily)
MCLQVISRTLIGCLLAISLTGAQKIQTPDETKEIAEILGRYVADYQSDPTLHTLTFGIQVAGDMWTVTTQGAENGDPAKAALAHKTPEVPTFYFTVDTLENLKKIDDGTMNFQTASARAFSSDYAPADVDVMEGYEPGPDFPASMFAAMFHFWTRGTPEVIPFGLEHTRFTHGSNATIFYYQEGFRSGWIHMKTGEHANEDPKSQTNEFPTLFIVTRGKCMARIDGETREIVEGEALIIPKGISHEFWNPNETPMEGVLLMFGDGA